MNRSSLAPRVAFLLLALCSVAHAGEHARLVVTRQQSAAECPDERALRDAVGARLGYEPFASDSPALVVVVFRREGSTLLATVQLQDAVGVVQGERTLSSTRGDCDELAATVALTISILLDPRAATASSGPAEPEREPAPAPHPDVQPQDAPKSSAEKAAPSPSVPSGEFAPPAPGARPSVPPKEGSHPSRVSFFPVALGAIQAFSAGGHAFGLRLGVGAQFELGPHWALRLPLVAAAALASSRADYAELALIPSAIYRFRGHTDDALTPYVGAGLKLGGFGAGRALLGKPLVSGSGVSIASLFDEQSYLDDPNFESTISVGAEATLGASWHASRSFFVDLELTFDVVPVAGVLVGVSAETAAARFVF